MVKETASTRNATSAARNTGSRGSPRIVFAPPPSPLFGILILMATVSTYTPILFRRSPPQKGLTPSRNRVPINSRVSQSCTLRHTTPAHKTQNPCHSDERAQRARRNLLHPPPRPLSAHHSRRRM